MPLLLRLLTLPLQVNGACVGDVVALGLVSPNPAEPPSEANTSDSGTKSELPGTKPLQLPARATCLGERLSDSAPCWSCCL
jgi:hypothetical protein